MDEKKTPQENLATAVDNKMSGDFLKKKKKKILMKALQLFYWPFTATCYCRVRKKEERPTLEEKKKKKKSSEVTNIKTFTSPCRW